VDQLFKDYDKNKDGYLTPDELPERLRHYFKQMDTNKDGKLSREEVEKGIAYLQPRRRPSDMIYVLIEMSDCDDDCAGEVQRAYDILRKLDTNKDGKIDADELKAMRHQLARDRVDALFKELDTNKDGKISRAEAKGQIKANFDKLDTNKDGFIDREELLQGALEKPATVPAFKPPTKKPAGRPEDK
jgi:Ca2+-binding EF-hand superfamily protein